MPIDDSQDPDTADLGDTLDPFEATDSDEIRDDDGDAVVDPPDQWIEPQLHQSLDERLADELPDISIDTPEPDIAEMEDGIPQAEFGQKHAEYVEGVIVEDSRVDRLQVDGTPEDGGSFFDVLE